MDIYIQKIIDDNKYLFGTIKSIKKIAKGFTNLLYVVNDEIFSYAQKKSIRMEQLYYQ